jgi:hypothetical protein
MADLFPTDPKRIHERIRRYERALKRELKAGYGGDGYPLQGWSAAGGQADETGPSPVELQLSGVLLSRPVASRIVSC